MTVSDLAHPETGMRRTPSAAHRLVVGPDDGYGDMALELLSLDGTEPWCGPAGTVDRLVVVLAGRARVSVYGGPSVTLAPNEVVHVGRGRTYVVELVDAGAEGSLEVLLLAGPRPR